MRASTPRDRVLATLVRTLGPYIGENMAGAAVRSQLEKLRLSGATLFEAEIEDLLGALGPGLHVFIGRATTAQALDTARQALGLSPPPGSRGSTP